MAERLIEIPLYIKDITSVSEYCPLDNREMSHINKLFNKVKPVLSALLKDVKKSAGEIDQFSIELDGMKQSEADPHFTYFATAFVTYKNDLQLDMGESKTIFAVKDAFMESVRILRDIERLLANNHPTIILNTFTTNKEDSIYCVEKRNMDLSYNIYYKWLELKINRVHVGDIIIEIPSIEFLKYKISGPREIAATGHVFRNDRDKRNCKFVGVTADGKKLKGTCVFDVDDDEKNVINDMWDAERDHTPVELTLVANQNIVCRERVPCGEYLMRDYTINPSVIRHETGELFTEYDE